MEDKGFEFDRFLFNELTHRFNLAKSRRHISDDVVGRRLISFKLAGLRGQLSGVEGLEEIVDSYEKDRDEAKKLSDELEQKLFEAELSNEKLQENNSALEKKIRSLEWNFEKAGYAESSLSITSTTLELPESLAAIPGWVAKNFPDTLEFISHAERSLQDSPYEDIEKAAKLFEVLASKFFAVYAGRHLKLEDAVETLRDIPAKYSPKMSEVTAGKKDGYERVHNNRKYSLQKHIGLGNSRAPRLCFRLFFEWEPNLQRIIVLHAGEHLDTQST